MEMRHCVTVQAPINIALIKYWGKTDETTMVPCNDSLSITLNSPQLVSVTTVTAEPDESVDTFLLNGQPEQVTRRMQACLTIARDYATRCDSCHVNPTWRLRIESRNTVPTAAGLASSASGFAALAFALIKLYDLDAIWPLEELAGIARVGSGSACRSMLGGFVLWQRISPATSVIKQVAPETHWPALRGLVVVFTRRTKETPSTAGMQTTVRTSTLFRHRVEQVVPERIAAIKRAIAAHDFAAMAELVMKDSNSLHACCLDTFPPIVYLTESSHVTMQLVHQFNQQQGRVAIGYTFDAGPNAVLFGLSEDMDQFEPWYREAMRLRHLSIDEVIPWTIGDGPRLLS